MTKPVTVRSFAKINLGLRIGPARPDGFHELLTVYQTIGLHDVIRVGVGRGTGIEIRCADPRVPRDEANTCVRIVERAMKALRAKGRVTIDIEKRLPVQGGLGGASSNAVATLLALERALKKSLPAAERLRIAAEVGSDLPLFLVGGTVLGIGRGEQVYPLEDLPAIPCVAVTPELGVSTPKAFAAWDRLCESECGAGAAAREGAAKPLGDRKRGKSQPAELRSARTLRLRSVETPTSRKSSEKWGTPVSFSIDGPKAHVYSEQAYEGARSHMRRGSSGFADQEKLTRCDPSDRMKELGRALSAWLSELHSGAPSHFLRGRGRAENPLLGLVRAGIENDFEQVVFPEYPELREGKRALLRAGAKCASLSGSGSTLYGLFASPSAAARAVSVLKKRDWKAQATATLTRRQYWSRVFG